MRDLSITDSYLRIKDAKEMDLVLSFLEWVILEEEPFKTQLHKDIRLLYLDKIAYILELYFTENTIVTIKEHINKNSDFSFNLIGTILSSFRKYEDMPTSHMISILSLFYMCEYISISYISTDIVISRKMVAAFVCHSIKDIEHISAVPFDRLINDDPLSFKKWFNRYVSKKSDIDSKDTNSYKEYLRDRVLFMVELGLLQYLKINTPARYKYEKLYNSLKAELSPLYQI